MPVDINRLVSFGNEYPDSLLVPVRKIAELLLPFEEAARDVPPEEMMAFFEILDLEARLAESYVNLVQEGGQLLSAYLFSTSVRLNNEKKRVRHFDRFMRALERVGNKLKDAGLPLAGKVIYDIDSHNVALTYKHLIETQGFDYAEAVSKQPLLANCAQASATVFNTYQFNWFKLAAAAKAPGSRLPRGTAQDMLASIRHLSLDFERGGQDVLFQWDDGTVEAIFDSRLFKVGFRGPNHPLGLASLLIIDKHTDAEYTLGEISRITGDVSFAHCVGASVRTAFTCQGNERAYDFLRDLCLASLYSTIATGVIPERAFMNAAATSSLPPATDIPEARPEEPATFIEPIPVMGQDAPRKVQPLRSSRYTWKNIMAAFRRLKVEVTWGGRHPKLHYNGRNATFLNPHSRQDPVYHRAILRQTLEKLGILEHVFEAQL
jgi:hypothetical protein